MSYDFTTLSPEDFEGLVSDLLSREWGSQLESFKPGKDGGIDLRHSRVPVGQPTTIVQCKRYAPHKVSQLLAACKKEARKLDIIKPERYVLVTSVGLSPPNKQQLLKIFSPWCQSSADIIGPSELNGLLRSYPDIERAHFKLWIASTAVLERVLHADIFGITESTVEATKRQLSRLVVHEGMNRALAMLAEHHHLLVVGNPGIGKSTLARMLMCHYMREGFEPVWVVSNISEAWAIIHGAQDANRKYVLVYDDFLGRLQFSSSRFGKNEEHSLMELLDKAARSPNIRLILTTREYIVADAKRVHGAFDSRAEELLSYTLSLQDYSMAHRAQMVFNHLYFSDLPDGRLEKLIETKAYRNLVRHTNFNPRIVESISRDANSRSLTDDQYIEFIEKEFDNPAKLWEQPFKSEIGPVARQVLAVLWSYNGAADIASLRSVTERLNDRLLPEEFSAQFNSALRQLDGNFIRTNRFPGRRVGETYLIAQFQNPSIEEFMDGVVLAEPTWLNRLAATAEVMTQIEQIADKAREVARGDLPVSFWHTLRTAARSCEGSKHCSLINLLSYGEKESRRVWSVDAPSLPEITLQLLQIDADAKSEDEQAMMIKQRVLSVSGWSTILARAPFDDSEAPAAARLQRWIVEQSDWGAHDIRLAQRRMIEAIIGWIGTYDVDIDLISLLTLVESATLQDKGIGSAERAGIVAIIEARLGSIQDEDADRLRWEVDALKSLSKILEVDFDDRLEILEERVQELEEQADPRDQSSEIRKYSSESGIAFDIDRLFVDLLDR